MACGEKITWYDLVPVLSYAALSGHCRFCGSGLSIQYPLVEFATGALFFFAALIVPPVASLWSVFAFVALLAFIASFIALVAYDIRHTLVPVPFLSALLASSSAAVIFQSLYSGSLAPLMDAAVGGAGLFLFFALVVLLTKGKGMGIGDAYVAGAIGILLGFFRGMEAIMLGIWAGTVFALFLMLLSSLSRNPRSTPGRGRVTMKTELPLIPFLAFGAAVSLYTGFSPLALVSSLMGTYLSNVQ
jgi:leader peptidase (prepilin peptidase)/N-methyltransferase